MKGQFFVISAIIIISAITLITQYFYDFGKIDLTRLQQQKELEYIQMAKESLALSSNISHSLSKCERLDADLNDVEDELKRQLLKKGINFESVHEIDCNSTQDSVYFEFSLISQNMRSTTDFRQMLPNYTAPYCAHP